MRSMHIEEHSMLLYYENPETIPSGGIYSLL